MEAGALILQFPSPDSEASLIGFNPSWSLTSCASRVKLLSLLKHQVLCLMENNSGCYFIWLRTLNKH